MNRIDAGAAGSAGPETESASASLRLGLSLARILDATPDLVGAATPDGHALYMNGGGRRLLGIGEDEDVRGADVFLFYPPEDARLIETVAFPTALAAGSWSGRVVLVSRGGRRVPVHQIILTFESETGERLLTTFARDIGPWQEREAEMEAARLKAEQANSAKSQILANMSHELRTPLNSVIGFSEMLVDGFYGELSERQRECVANIVEAGQHLLDLINDVLDLAKVEAGRLTLSLADLDAGSLVADLVDTLRALALGKGLSLELAVADAAPTVRADPRRVKQIVLNLLSNAVKFTPDGGRITVAVRPAAETDGVWIEVRDSGIGVAPEDQGSLFEPFRQLDASLRRSQQGTGLGLALTRRLVELHGGRVWMESEGSGRGATFHVVLPRGGPARADGGP